MNLKALLATSVMVLATSSAIAETNHNHHNMHENHGYAPLNLAGTHSHEKNEWMLSYKYMEMEMDGMRNGENSVDKNAVYASYNISPLSMTTKTHMTSAMYGIDDNFTFMAMVPYVEKSMKLRTKTGVNFTTKSSGLGDIKLSVIDDLNYVNFNGLSAMYTLSLPTGSIHKRDATPAASDPRLPYSMQLGSGTFDITPALTYQHNCDCHGINFGAQAFATFRINDNREDYRLGNIYGASAWAGKSFTDELSAGLTLKAEHQSKINGTDGNLNAAMVPTADTTNTGHEKATAGFDVLYEPKSLKGYTFAADYTAPIYQDVNGFQMDSKHMFTLAIRKTF